MYFPHKYLGFADHFHDHEKTYNLYKNKATCNGKFVVTTWTLSLRKYRFKTDVLTYNHAFSVYYSNFYLPIVIY